MKLKRLFLEAIHPDLYASAVAINKKVAAQLKDIPTYTPEENPDIYKGGWVLGNLQIGHENFPVAMLMDGSVTMRTHFWGDTHNTWPTVEKFMLYVKKQLKKAGEAPALDRFIKLLEQKGSLDHGLKYLPSGQGLFQWMYSFGHKEEMPDPEKFSMLIYGSTWNKVAKAIGVDLPLDPPKLDKQLEGLGDEDEFESYDHGVLVTADDVKVKLRNSTRILSPTWWPPEIMPALKQLYQKTVKKAIREMINSRVREAESEARAAKWRAEHEPPPTLPL